MDMAWNKTQILNRLEVLEKAARTTEENVNTFFLITVSMIIYLMQCGFAFLEAGSVRSKNVVNILIKNLLDTFVSGLSYWLVGYAFAFGEGNAFIGYTWFAHHNMPQTQLSHWFFQFVFAATAATIVSGAVAERCDFNAYLVYSFCVTGFIYPVVTHWAWTSEGWLAAGINITVDSETSVISFQDFAGSGVVHTVGGVFAFFGALFLGPRHGRFDEQGCPQDIRGHSIPLAALGGFILLFGFFAFNGGSEGQIAVGESGVAVSRAIVNTVLAATGGGFTTLVLNKIDFFGDAKWSLLSSINGCLGGMVAICAGCNVMHSYGALVTGIVGGFSYFLTTWLVLKVKVDDPLDATAVHFGGGVAGVLLVPFFNSETGILYKGDKMSAIALGWNAVGLVAIIAWCSVFAVIIFGGLKFFGIDRVPEELELRGLDIPKHGETAYPAEAYGHGWGEKGDGIKELVKSIIPFTLTPAIEGPKKRKSRKLSDILFRRKSSQLQNRVSTDNGFGAVDVGDVKYVTPL